MPIKHFSWLFCIAVAITAFKAERPNTWRVKQSVNLLTGSSASYFYGEDGRLARIENSKGFTSTYSYISNSVIKRTTGSDVSLTPIDTMTLNADGMATTLKSAGTIHSMKYDSLKRFVESVQQVGNKIIGKGVWNWVGGNLNTYINYDEKDTVVNGITYEYYTGKLNTIGDTNRGMRFWGRDSKNLVKKSYAIVPDNVIAEYNYRFNQEGAVILKVSYTNGKMVDSTSYTYY